MEKNAIVVWCRAQPSLGRSPVLLICYHNDFPEEQKDLLDGQCGADAVAVLAHQLKQDNTERLVAIHRHRFTHKEEERRKVSIGKWRA